jgi:hypothetical protein
MKDEPSLNKDTGDFFILLPSTYTVGSTHYIRHSHSFYSASFLIIQSSAKISSVVNEIFKI